MIEIVAFAVVSAIIIVYLKSLAPEISLLATVSAGVILLIMIASKVSEAFLLMDKLVNLSGISKDYYKIVLKVIGIGYLTEFGAGLIEDFGLKGLASKLIVCGKVVIICISMPVIYAMFELVINIIK